jgi:hypothetical protein
MAATAASFKIRDFYNWRCCAQDQSPACIDFKRKANAVLSRLKRPAHPEVNGIRIRFGAHAIKAEASAA